MTERPLVGMSEHVGSSRKPRVCEEVDALTKKHVIRQVADGLGISQTLAQELVQRTLDAILETVVQEGRLELRNFGVFQIKARAARQARNPRTNEPVRVPPRNAVTFQTSKNFAKRISQPEPVREAAPQPIC